MIVKFADLDCMSPPTLVLRNLDGTAIQTLGYAFGVELDLNYNEISTISFQLPKYVEGERTPHYDEVVGMRIIDVLGVGQFILVDPQEEDDGVRCVKSCKGYSLEYEFAKKNIYLEGGTYSFFDGIDTHNPDTIIGRILERMPDWTADVDDALIGRYRTFEDLNKKIYDLIKSDLQKPYGCIFDFDTYTRTIHVRSVDTPVPETQVYLSQESLIKKLDINEDSERIVTCLDVYGADGVDIRSVNPTGTNKIYNLDYFMNTVNFSQDMIDAWRAWEAAVAAAQDTYYQITISYNMKLMEILNAQAKLADLETELSVLINKRAVAIQLISEGITPQPGESLAEVNAQIEGQETAIGQQESLIEGMKDAALLIDQQRRDINAELDFDTFFAQYQEDTGIVLNPVELATLPRYFIEDTMEDSTFVMRNAITYDPQELNTALSNQSVEIDSLYTSAVQEDERVFSFTDGTVSVSTLDAKVIRATLFYNSEAGTFVFTAYLNGGTVGTAAFESGNLTIAGTAEISADESGSSLTFTAVDGQLYFTENATEYELHQIEWELYDHSRSVLYEHASPTYNFSVDSVNFLAMNEYRIFHNALTLGERVYLNIDDEILTPYVVHVHVSYENPGDFQIEFSSTYTAFDHSFALAELLEQSVSMGKTLDYKGGMYSAFVNSGASSSVKTFMDSALDVAKNHVLSSGSQAITFDDTGIRVRKYTDGGQGAYDPEEIWLVNNMMVFTDDAWDTAKMAIGKIFDPNLVGYEQTSDSARDPDKTYYIDQNGTVWDPSGSIPWSTSLYEKTADGKVYGIAAPYIVGTMIAGQNLVIDSVKPDGTNSVFRVDGSGASLYNASFTVFNNRGKVVLDPELGFGIGKGTTLLPDIITDNTGTGGTREWNENAKFWVDTDGNVNFAGTLSGATGVFSGQLQVGHNTSVDEPNFRVQSNGTLSIGPYSAGPGAVSYNFEVDPDGNVRANNGTFGGVLKAKDIQMPDGTGGWTSVLTEKAFGEATANSKVAPDYLELKGISVIDDSDPFNPRTTFHVDGSTGNVTMSGSLLADGSISATTITASTMRGGRVEGASFYATGQGRNEDTAFYICNQYEDPNDPSAPLSPTYIDGYVPYEIGYLSFDALPTSDTKYSAKYRVLLKTTGVYSRTATQDYSYTARGLALKLESTGDISLSAGVDVPAQYVSRVEQGSIILASRIRLTTASFGTSDPGDIWTSGNPAAEGQIYFKLSS